ncbi:hypothetical protein [Rhizobium leguminosarum]|uniref:hypothetical protein n=1 Tax=Rhizobium leguminosarum TaxID=384 RepID=UPI0013E8F875|nr:hypothetical protein [Rhizobium leguminosarum]
MASSEIVTSTIAAPHAKPPLKLCIALETTSGPMTTALARGECLSDVVREKGGVTDDSDRFAGDRTERFHSGRL